MGSLWKRHPSTSLSLLRPCHHWCITWCITDPQLFDRQVGCPLLHHADLGCMRTQFISSGRVLVCECLCASAGVRLQSTHSSKGPEWLGTLKRRRQPEFSRPPFPGAWSVRVPVRHVKQVRVWWVIPVPVKIKANSLLDCILCHDKTFGFALLVLLKFVPFYVIYFCRLFGLFFMFVCSSVLDLFSLFSCWRPVLVVPWWWWCCCRLVCSLLRAGFWVHQRVLCWTQNTCMARVWGYF